MCSHPTRLSHRIDTAGDIPETTHPRKEQALKLELLSERLSLRPLDTDDVEDLHSLWTEEPVRRFLWDGEVIPLEQTRDIVAKNGALFGEFGFGIWGVRERGAEELLGFTGYWHFRTPPALELLFGVAPKHWKRGIATESSRSVIRHGFEVLGFQSIEASHDVGNAAPARVLEKLAMTLERRDVVDGLDTAFYKLKRESWEQVTQPADAEA